MDHPGGGSGTRLYPSPAWSASNFLPVYDKPMIYYPLSVLMLAGNHRILVISTRPTSRGFRELLGDGRPGDRTWMTSPSSGPQWAAQAFVILPRFVAATRSP